jgi:hypothetical protein
MASEILAVPEEHLEEVIKIIRMGLEHFYYGPRHPGVHPDVREQLLKWCDDEEEYLKTLAGDE